MRLRDEADRVTRYVGVLDAAREHAAVAQQELTRHQQQWTVVDAALREAWGGPFQTALAGGNLPD